MEKVKIENKSRPLASALQRPHQKEKAKNKEVLKMKKKQNAEIKSRLIERKKQAFLISRWMDVDEKQLKYLTANDLCELEVVMEIVEQRIGQLKRMINNPQYYHQYLLVFLQELTRLGEQLKQVRKRLSQQLNNRKKIYKKNHKWINQIIFTTDEGQSKQITKIKNMKTESSENNQSENITHLEVLKGEQSQKEPSKIQKNKKSFHRHEFFLFTEPPKSSQSKKHEQRKKSIIGGYQKANIKNLSHKESPKTSFFRQSCKNDKNDKATLENSLLIPFQIKKKDVETSSSQFKKKIKFDLKQSLKKHYNFQGNNKYSQNASFSKELSDPHIRIRKEDEQIFVKRTNFLKKNSSSVHLYKKKPQVQNKSAVKKEEEKEKNANLKKIVVISQKNYPKISFISKQIEMKIDEQVEQQKQLLEQRVRSQAEEQQSNHSSCSRNSPSSSQRSFLFEQKAEISHQECNEQVDRFLKILQKKDSDNSESRPFTKQKMLIKQQRGSRMRKSKFLEKKNRAISLKKQKKEDQESFEKTNYSTNQSYSINSQSRNNSAYHQPSIFAPDVICEEKGIKKFKPKQQLLRRKQTEYDKDLFLAKKIQLRGKYRPKDSFNSVKDNPRKSVEAYERRFQKEKKQALMNKIFSLREQFEEEYDEKINVQSKNSLCSTFWKYQQHSNPYQEESYILNSNKNIDQVKSLNKKIGSSVTKHLISPKGTEFLQDSYQIYFVRVLSNKFSQIHQIGIQASPMESKNTLGYQQPFQ